MNENRKTGCSKTPQDIFSIVLWIFIICGCMFLYRQMPVYGFCELMMVFCVSISLLMEKNLPAFVFYSSLIQPLVVVIIMTIWLIMNGQFIDGGGFLLALGGAYLAWSLYRRYIRSK